MNAQDLKNSILQRAIEGKLVPQMSDEGDARELLAEIRAEKEQLIKEKKIKRTKALPPIEEDEKPFVIPESWEWVRLGDILFSLTDGTHKTPKYTSNGIPFLSVKNISSGKLSFENTKFISAEEHKILTDRCHPQKGDILLSKVGTTGIPVLIDTDKEFSIFVSVALLKYSTLLNSRYLLLAIQSPIVQKQCQENTRGVGNKNWVLKDIANTILPLLPLAEQKRIVAKVEELLPYIEQYDKAHTKLSALNAKFPEQMKKSLLQYAMEGKLVPQCAEDGTADELLAEIRAEKERIVKEKKIKKTKPLPEISDEEKPFEIPKNWRWVRLQEICNAIVDCPHSTPKYLLEDEGYYAIDTNCIDANGNITGFRFVDEVTYNKRIARIVPMQNDIILTREGSIGRAAILPENKKICLGQRVMLLRTSSYVDVNFLKQLIMAPTTLLRLTEKQKGLGAKHINVSDICKLTFPLPPLAEQKRIVARLEELLPYCDKIMK